MATGDTRQLYARTGYLGFVRRTDSIAADGSKFIKILNTTKIYLFSIFRKS
jgi:hypothetical protein